MFCYTVVCKVGWGFHGGMGWGLAVGRVGAWGGVHLARVGLCGLLCFVQAPPGATPLAKGGLAPGLPKKFHSSCRQIFFWFNLRIVWHAHWLHCTESVSNRKNLRETIFWMCASFPPPASPPTITPLAHPTATCPPARQPIDESLNYLIYHFTDKLVNY